MKVIKELYVKYDIYAILKRMFLSLINVIKRIIKIIVYMPFYVMYVNVFIFILGKFDSMNNDVILKALDDINTIYFYVNIFIYVIVFFILRWYFRKILGISNDDKGYSTLGKEVGSLRDTSNNFYENKKEMQKAKFTLYENGAIKESTVLEYDPNEDFSISNIKLEKTYLLLKEDIEDE